MCARPGPQKRRIGFVGAALAVTVVSVVLTPTAFARITVNTVDTPAVVADNGRHLVVKGPIAFSAEARAYLEVTVTQRATGAVAAARTRITCSSAIAQWEIHASTQGAERFPGRARHRGRSRSHRQRCRHCRCTSVAGSYHMIAEP